MTFDPSDDRKSRFRPWWMMLAAVAFALSLSSFGFAEPGAMTRHRIFALAWTAAAAIGIRLAGADRVSVGLNWGNCDGWRAAGIVTALALAAFAVAYALFVGHPSTLDVKAWPTIAAFQLIWVAAPEELFFRGYSQGLFRRRGSERLSTNRIDWNAVLHSSALFATAHVAAGGSLRSAATFFPGLLFGWLRERTGSILPPILAHVAANIVVAALEGRSTIL